ncbi:MAG: NADH-quinone oxidoreductase subunit N [Holosporales bacterium]|nr:NADH-quinone oxidoreductase subunit N [Holosporales bacterium]
MFSTSDFLSLLPEFFLSASILLETIFCLFYKKNKEQDSKRFLKINTLILLGVLVLVILGPEQIIFFQEALEITPLIRSFKILLLLTTLGVFSLSAISWIFRFQFVFEYPLLMLLSLLGGLFAISSNDFLVLFIGLELQTLPLYILVVFDKRSFLASEAGIKYFTLGSLAAGFFLFGISLVYGAVGTIDFNTFNSIVFLSLESGSSWQSFPPYFFLGIIFILGGLFFKLSLVPFHMWAPDVYEGSTTPTTLFLASCVKLVSIFVLFRLFQGPFSSVHHFFQNLLGFVAGLSMLIGALGGMAQKNFKRLLAYSGITHMGYLLCAVIVGGSKGFTALLSYLMVYMPMVILSFTLLMILKKNYERSGLELRELKGLAQSAPVFSFVMAGLMFSFAGIPPLGGFFGKLNVLLALVQEHIFLASIAVLSSVISCYYYLRIVKVMYFEKRDETSSEILERWDLSFQNQFILFIILIITFGFGLLFPFLSSLIETAF